MVDMDKDKYKTILFVDKTPPVAKEKDLFEEIKERLRLSLQKAEKEVSQR